MMKIEEINELSSRFKKVKKALANFESYAIDFVEQGELQKINRNFTEINLWLNDLEYKARYDDEN